MNKLKYLYRIILLSILFILFVFGNKICTASFIGSDNVYCAESGQGYLDYDSYSWENTVAVTKSSDDGEGWHILGYIAYNHAEQFNPQHYIDGDGTHHGYGDSQAAIWKTLQMYEYVRDELGTTIPLYACNHGVSYYEEAQNGTDYNYTVKIYVWQAVGGHDGQALIELHATREEITPTVNLEFKKIDFNGNGVSDVGLTVSGENNVSSITGTNICGWTDGFNWNGLLSASDGKFSTIGIKPTNNNGTFKIKLEEVYTPSDYGNFPGQVTLTIHYDTTNGNVTDVDIPFGYEKYFNIDENESGVVNLINIKNPKKPEYKIVKVDDEGNKLGGAKFNIVIEKINNTNYGLTSGLTSSVTTNDSGEAQILNNDMKDAILNEYMNTTDPNIEVLIKIEEIEPPQGYISKFTPTTYTLIYDGKNLKNSDDSNIVIENEKIPPLGITLDASGSWKWKEEGKEPGKKGYSSTETGGSEIISVKAKFDVTFEQDENVVTYTIDTDPSTTIPYEAKYQPISKNNVKITIHETEVENGWNKIDDIVINCTYDEENKKWIYGNNGNSGDIGQINHGEASIVGETDGGIAGLEIIETPKTNIKIIKQDEAGNNLKDIEFNGAILGAKSINGESSGEISGGSFESKEDVAILLNNIKTNSNGEIEINNIEINNNAVTGDIMYIVLNETDVSQSISTKLKEKTLMVAIKWDANTSKWEMQAISETEKMPVINYYNSITGNEIQDLMEENTDYKITNDSNLIGLIIKNESILNKLILTKKDSQTGNVLQDVKFEIELENVKSCTVNGETVSASSNVINKTVTTNSSGQIEFNSIILAANKTDMIITVKEIGKVGYKTYQGNIKITLTKTSDGFTITGKNKDGTITDTEFNVNSDIALNTIDENKQDLSLSLRNIPVMNLGGIVWEDGQTGVKAVELPNGKKDEDTGMAGIQVTLYKYKEGESTPITKDIYGNTLMTKTASAGDTLTYKMYNGETDTITLEAGEYIFPNLEKGTKYYVVFTYDGINYKTTITSQNLYADNNESKVNEDEVERDAFNAKFQTITDSTTTDTTTNSYAKANGVDEDLVYSYEVKENGVISTLITTDNNGVLDQYKMTAKSADYLDYLKTADDWIGTWTSDGKINREHYALDINCGLLEKYFDLNLSSSIENIIYTINGKTLEEKSDDDSEPRINRDSKIFWSDYTYRYDKYDNTNGFVNDDEQANRQELLKEDTELEVYVTYKITVATGSTYNAKANEILYNYSDKQELLTGAEETKLGIATVSGDVDYENNSENSSITIKPKQKLTSTNNAQEIYITLRLKKDAYRNLPSEILNPNGLDCVNTAEIISYSTDEGGLIDNDSAPGNYLEDRKNENSKREDDETYTIVNFKIKEEKREISGNVAEANENGELLNEKNINDVIVQLIEVIQVPTNGQYLEYIWQETKTGSSEVKARGELNELYTYNNGLTGDVIGQYRFLGHSLDEEDSAGTVVNLDTGFIPGNYIIRFIYGDGSTYDVTPPNVKKYNGQDYKSATDLRYKEEWYNPSNYGPNYSVARDNEARRLEVMSYSTTINKDKWEAIENKRPEMLENTWMCAETSKIDVGIDTIKYDAVNFGLELRPETKLVLEKHITGLKITPTGTGVQPVVDARANISQILNNTEIATEGMTTGLSTIKSSRDERGFWKVETDIEELAQGATLEVEYTYVIKDESDVDYLSNTLIEAYKNQDTKPYSEVLNEICTTVKETMRNGEYSYSNNNKIGTYLGQYYYTKTKGSEDREVLSRVDTVEDYLDNRLNLSEQASNVDFEKSNTGNVDKNMYDTDGKFVENGLKIETVIQNKEKFKFLRAKSDEEDINDNNADYTKTVSATTSTSASNKEITYPGYIAQIMQYSNAAGRRDMDACPGNLSYIYSEDNEMTLDSYVKYNDSKDVIEIYTEEGGAEEAGYVRLNEDDEYWGCGGEKIMVTKPTGEDKQEPLQIAIIAISSIAVLGVGIVLIKKFVLKK